MASSTCNMIQPMLTCHVVMLVVTQVDAEARMI